MGDEDHEPEVSEVARILIVENFDYDLEQRTLIVHLKGSPTQSHIATSILIEALVYTFTELPLVDRVMVTLNGEPWSDGHVLWEEPLGRDSRS